MHIAHVEISFYDNFVNKYLRTKSLGDIYYNQSSRQEYFDFENLNIRVIGVDKINEIILTFTESKAM